MSVVRSYRDLVVWQQAIELTKCVYQLTESFPKSECYGLTSQLQRSAVSIPSNIAEGHARGSTKEYLYHLSVAMGSLAELETQIIIASELNYISSSRIVSILELSAELGRKLRNLQKSLKNKLQ